MLTSDDGPYEPEKQIYTTYQVCQITFSLRANQGYSFAFGYVKSLSVLKGFLIEEIRKKALEATINAFQQENQGCTYTIRVLCRFKNPMHSYVVRRIITGSIATQKIFHISRGSRIKVCQTSLDAVRQSYVLQPPENGEPWLRHSLLCSKAHDMPLAEFVEELGKAVTREESNLLRCFSWEQYRKQAWAMQTLLYSIHEVLLTKCNGSGGLAQGVDVRTRTAAVAARSSLPSTAESARTQNYPCLSLNAGTPCLPSNAATSIMHDAPIGALNSTVTETIGATTATSPTDEPRRRLNFTLRLDASAPLETPEHRERPSGDSQARYAITRMVGYWQQGITATQLYFWLQRS